MNAIRSYDIGRPTEKIGFFEIRYRHDGGLKSMCLVGYGFQDAVRRFNTMKLGEYASMREVREEDFEAWFNVTLNVAKTAQDLRTGVQA